MSHTAESSKMSRPCNAQQGFTLIELAVVVAIVGLLLGGLLIPLATQVDAQRVEATENDLAEIKDALYGYMVSANPLAGPVVNRLPCPDCMESTDGDCGSLPAAAIGDGREDFSTVTVTSCATYEGNVPWVTLGVSQFDSWNRNYRYAVSTDFADGLADGVCGNTTASIGLCTQGDLVVRDSAGGTVVAQNMAAVVLSLGDDTERTLCSEAADPSASQNENTDCDTDFVSSTRIDDPGNQFDDVTVWISPNVIKAKLIDVSILP